MLSPPGPHSSDGTAAPWSQISSPVLAFVSRLPRTLIGAEVHSGFTGSVSLRFTPSSAESMAEIGSRDMFRTSKEPAFTLKSAGISAIPATPAGTSNVLRTANQSFEPVHPPIAGPPLAFFADESMKSAMILALNHFCAPCSTPSYFTSHVNTSASTGCLKKTGVYTIPIFPSPLNGTTTSRFPSGTRFSPYAAPHAARAATTTLASFIVYLLF